MAPARRRHASLIVAVVAVVLSVTTPGSAAVPADWSGYLFDTEHGSYNAAATAITPSNVGSLTRYWQWKTPPPTMTGQPGVGLYSSPTVVAGRVYIGANTGVFYALDLATKSVLWSRFLGFLDNKYCGRHGFVSTATVVPDASRGGQLTVYVAAADGYLYALNASDGTVVWRAVVAIPSSKGEYYNWGSPAVRDGAVYMGISSYCDAPLVRAGVESYDQASGAQLGTYWSVPAGTVGGSLWSSVAVNAGGSVFAATGNGAAGSDAQSIVRLSGTALARADGWRIPPGTTSDADFGASPTLFTATLNGASVPMVGACNKNGRYYALRQENLAAGPVWTDQVAVGTPAGQSACLTAAVWDGSRLFVAATQTTIGGTQFPGSIRRLNPATGAVIWARGLGNKILGSPTLDGTGVLAAGSYNLSGADVVYLLDSATGRVLRTLGVGYAQVYGQPVFADNYLLIPTTGSPGLLVYKV